MTLPASSTTREARAPLAATRLGRVLAAVEGVAENVAAYFRGHDPTFRHALVPALIVACLLYVRSPLSNYIFDEQEALLANPYVNGEGLGVLDAFRRDFWGLPPERSIGSYRPVPNLIWRLVWQVTAVPFVHHLVNVLVHALNASLVASLTFRVVGQRAQGWLAGACFVMFAVLTEAVSGVVGIADVLGGLGVLLALHALRLSWLAPLGVFAALMIGLLSKESAIVGVPLVAWSALVLAPLLHPKRPLRGLRTFGVSLAALAALVAYTYLRRTHFPISLSAELSAPLPASEPAVRRAFHAFLRWFQQPHLPHDPINNPLVDAELPERVAGALRVYARGLGQLILPLRLSGDYSFPAEPVPEQPYFLESIVGGALLVLPPLAAPLVFVGALVRERRERRAATSAGARFSPSVCLSHAALAALALLWIPLAYFPHSNIPVLLPTVRAERFWYMPAIGAALVFGPLLVYLVRRLPSPMATGAIAGWLVFQALAARWHALDYTDDLVFWRATRAAVPTSAKAQLNYSVMVGARGNLEERLVSNRTALELAPRWAMAHVYLGDTLCRLSGRAREAKRPAEQARLLADAWPSYVKGFTLAPNDPNLIALGLQCLWEEKAVEPHREELIGFVDEYKGTWLAFLASDIVYHGKQHDGVQKQYRPRSYDGGPKE